MPLTVGPVLTPLFPSGQVTAGRSWFIGLFSAAALTVSYTGLFQSTDNIINIPLKFANFFRTRDLDEFSDRRLIEQIRINPDPEYASLNGYRDSARSFLNVGLVLGGALMQLVQNRKHVKGNGAISFGSAFAWTGLSLGMNFFTRAATDGIGNAKLRQNIHGDSAWNWNNWRPEDFCINLFVSTWSLAIFFSPFFAIGTKTAVAITEKVYKRLGRGSKLPFFAEESLPSNFVYPGLVKAFAMGSTWGYLGLLTLFTGTVSGIGTVGIRLSQEYENPWYLLVEFGRSYLSMLPSRLFLIAWMIKARRPLSVYAYNLPSLLLTIYPPLIWNANEEAGAQKFHELAQDDTYASSPQLREKYRYRLTTKATEIETKARRRGLQNRSDSFVKQWEDVQKMRQAYSLGL